jgi:hypothetical protein
MTETINPTPRRVAALVAAAEAKAAADAAKAAYDAAKAALLKVCPEAGVLEAEGFKANIVVAERTEFNADAAEEWLEEDDFEAISTRKIDPKLWKALSYKFDAKIINAVVITKPTTTLTIKEVSA